MDMTINLDEIDREIDDLLRDYIAVNSETGTGGEKSAEEFLIRYFENLPYYQEHPSHFGAYPLEGDPAGRSVCWALARGEGDDAVVLIHHYDVVGVEDFKNLKDFAFLPDGLEAELAKIADDLPPEAREDLLSGQYLFGRGTADMKGGGAIQLALLKRHTEVNGWKGNLILLALPDEENLSAGMRAAIDLLTELRDKYSLKYIYAFNSEPHQRKKREVGLLSEGSVGKILASVYVRGFLSHVGKVFEGLNPVAVLSEIAAQTELSPAFSDVVGGESAPPPTWLYLRDRKDNYDVSMPLGAGGCISILTLDSNPIEVLEKLKQVASDSFDDVIGRMNEKYRVFCRNTGQEEKQLPWTTSVMTYSELLEEAYAGFGEAFETSYKKQLERVGEKIKSGEMDLMESSFVLTEHVYNFITDLSPRVILGFVPPYYPNVSNLLLDGQSEEQKTLAANLSDFSETCFGHRYDREYYYTGISDLSYFALKDGKGIKEEMERDMPLYGSNYSIPLEKIEMLSMPCMNIGPWGKDFHKLTERVYKPDLYERTPALLNRAIRIVLEKGAE
jgi:arginine utilization protein RocB